MQKSRTGLQTEHTSHDGLAAVLELLADETNLAILRMVTLEPLTSEKLAARLRIPVEEAFDRLANLVSAGIAGYSDGEDGRTIFANRTALAAIAAGLVDLLTPAAETNARSGQAERRLDFMELDVPTAPPACMVCENAGFVGRVLGAYDDLLSEGRHYQLQLKKLSSEVLAAQEAERKRIARELHDDTAQTLTSILVRLRLLDRLAEAPALTENIEELRDLTSNALDNVRRIAMDLRPAALDDLGLPAALESFVERFAERWEIDATCDVARLKSRLPAEIELVLYRVAQEALNNVARHAGATSAHVHLAAGRRDVTLTISDDGCGFDRASTAGGFGLFGIGERLALVGGTVKVDSRRGKGTRLIARVRLPAERSEE